MVLCKCVFLDGKEVFLTVEKDATGSDLYDSICEYIGIKYRDPFGVAFRGGAAPAPYSWWVRMDKSLTGQIPGKCKIWEFAFLVKYYPKSLTGMQDVMARHHVILQIRQDLLTGRLKCPVQTMSHLCSYWLQAQYGDWSSRRIDMQLADAFRFVQKGEQSPDGHEGRSDLNFEEQMMQMHQTHRGMSALDAEYRFIRLAASLPNYGIHYYPACLFTQSQQQKQAGRRPSLLASARSDASVKSEKVTIGVGPLGVHQYRRKGNEIVFTWKAMRAVSFKKNRIVLKMQGALRHSDQDLPAIDNTSKKNLTKEYEFADMFQTKIVWQVMIEYHMFFRVGDQKGLKGNQRKQLLSNLKVKRSIPMVGEKKIEAQSSISPTDKNSPKSDRKSRFSLSGRSSKKRASSLPPPSRGNSGERETSPSRRSARELSRNDKVELSNVESPKDEKNASSVSGKPGEGDISARTPNIDVMEPDKSPIRNVRGLVAPSTPMSGTFVFPQRSMRSRSSSFGRPSTSAGEVGLPFDGLSMASDDTDELCNPDLLGDAYPYSDQVPEVDERPGKYSISPRSQSTARSDVPKLQLDGVDSKDDPNSGQKREVGPFVIPAEILIDDLRRCRKLKEEGGKIEEQNDRFPIELDFKHQPRRSRYLNDANLIAAYDHEFVKQAESSYTGRRTRSLASLRPKLRGTENSPFRSSSRERSLSPMSVRNPTAPKSAVSDTPRRRHHPRKAQSETRLPQTSSKDGEVARSSGQDDKSARSATRGAQSARLSGRGELSASSGFVAHLPEAPAVKPRKSISSLKKEKKEDAPSSTRQMDDHPPTLM